MSFDSKLCKKEEFSGVMAGVDEAGRGPLAGPVVAAAVIFLRKVHFPGLNDSKQVSPEKRENLFWEISRHAFVGIGMASEEEIDTINIYHASLLAMKRALLALPRTPDLVLIDGNAKVDWPLPQKTVIEGDAKSACIAAASIIAKVYRDAWMKRLEEIYPGYGFDAHKGYATEKHIMLLNEKGPSPVHRKSFEPVRAMFEKAPL